MKNERSLARNGKTIPAMLVIAATGVIVQIAAGADYPTVPPVFFILLIPAGLIAFGRSRWTFVVSLIATLFLTWGLFTSGAYKRLFHAPNPADSFGLWIQSIAVLLAMCMSIVSIAQYKKQHLAR